MPTRAHVAFFLVCSTLALAACGAGGPEQLAERVEKAIAARDVDALVAVSSLEGSPAMVQSLLLALPSMCANKVCAATVKPVSPEWEAQTRPQLEQEGVEYPTAVEGLIEVLGRDADESDASKHTMSMEIPYAKVAGEYRLVAPRFTAAKRAEREAMTAQAAAEATLAKGIYNDETSSRDTEWKAKASALPADGGAAGAAFLAGVGAMAAAIKANDPDAALNAGDERIAALLTATDYNGKPVSLDDRRANLRSQAVVLWADAKVLGGWQFGDQAVLIVEGTNGAGAAVRGAQLMKLEDGAWRIKRDETIEIPKSV